MELQGISKLDLKRRNRIQILKVIKENGPISRVDIASSMKITRAAVTIITNEMIEEGVLYEVGEAPVSLDNLQKGRRKILIDINENYKFALGASISDERICIGLTNLNGKILDKTSTDVTPEMTNEDILNYITDSCKNILINSCLDSSKLLGLGVAIQSDMCSKMKVYYKDGKLDYSKVIKVLTASLGIDVICSNLTSSLALANQLPDLSERSGNYAFIKLGNHVNLAILLENEVMHENVFYTNHVEKMIVNPGGRKLEGYPDGSVRAELTRDAIISKYKEVFSQENTPVLWEVTNGNPENIYYKTLWAAASKGDSKTLEVLNNVLQCLCVLINNLSVAFFTKSVILHGFKMNDWTYEYFKKFITDFCGEEVAKKIHLSRVEDNFEFKGGTCSIILDNFFNKGGIDNDQF
ncbi:winged helix-turn-helix transcriptional regulator [Porcipelethomonas sp.]|uniref:ROK family transcriptional regulator n=1 Tax=Porcipelethomonas sp. TaxID=2981675 RepID=UPI003EFA0F2B